MPSFSEYYWAGRRGHLIGVGGVSMSPLAEVLAEAGLVITGSDMNASVSTDELIEQGIPVAIGHRAENIEDKEKRLEAIGKNDRPMQPEEFNCCMETAQLNYEMVKEEKSFIIRRK